MNQTIHLQRERNDEAVKRIEEEKRITRERLNQREEHTGNLQDKEDTQGEVSNSL